MKIKELISELLLLDQDVEIKCIYSYGYDINNEISDISICKNTELAMDVEGIKDGNFYIIN